MVPAGVSRSSRQRRQLGVDLVEARADGAEQPLAASVGATLRVVRVSSRRPSRSSSRAHGVAERRLRDAELRGGAGEAALARDGEEGEQVVDVGAGHS